VRHSFDKIVTIFLLLWASGCSNVELPPEKGNSSFAPDLTEPLGADEARAGFLTPGASAAYIGGVAGEGTTGDVLLYNDRARFTVQGLRAGDGYMHAAGNLIDMDIVRPTGQADRDGLDDLHTMPGLGRMFHADTIEVVSSGVDGDPAVVRAIGSDATFSFLEGAVEAPGFFPIYGLDITQTYTLEPGSTSLLVETAIHNPTDEAVSLEMLDGGMVDMGTHAMFIPGAGFDGTTPAEGQTMIAAVGQRYEQAFAVYLLDGNLEDAPAAAIGSVADLVMAKGTDLALEPGATDSYIRHIGVARDLATLEEHRRSVQGLPTGVVEGTLTEADSGDPIAGAAIFLTDGDGVPQTMAVTGDDGSYRIAGGPGAGQLVALGDGNNEWVELPAGIGAYGVYAHQEDNELAVHAFAAPDQVVASPRADGYGRSEPVSVTLADGETVSQDLSLTAPAILQVRVEDDAGVAMPSVVHLTFTDGVDPMEADGRLGESRGGNDARRTAWLLDGEADVPIVPGTYDLVAHRGFRHELDMAYEMELVSGETAAVTLVLEEAYTTPGWVNGDLHVHASPSIDGKCTMEERLVTVAAADVDLLVSTDHDVVADYRPLLRAMGLDAWMQTAPGLEFSPVVRGHFNLYPLVPDPSLPNNGAPRWWEHQINTSDLLDLMHTTPGDELVQVNHGYSPGMFSLAGYDAYLGEPAEPEFYSDGFDTLEILNGKSYGDMEHLRDTLCAHLDQGLRPVGTGTSDSHTRWHGPGRARTYVQLDVHDVGEMDQEAFFDALGEGKAVVSGGPFVILTAETEGGAIASVGDTVNTGSATLRAEIFTPSWMLLDEVILYTRGCTVLQRETVEGASPDGELVEFDVEPYGDTYYFIEVRGSDSMSPVWPGAWAYAMTNPIFISEM